jgi:hypothetical protein
MNIRQILLLGLASVAGVFSHVRGADFVWHGGGDGVSWIDPLNWDQAAVPGPADHAILDVPGEVTVVVSGPMSVGSFLNHERLVMLGSGSTGMGSLSVSNGAENHGVIALDSVDGAWSSGYFSGATLTNRATGVIEVKAGAGGLRSLSTSIENHGTIRSDEGVFVEADATGLAFRQLGGSMQAVMGWSGGSFDFVDGTVGGFLMLRNSAVTVHETADPGSLLVVCGSSGQLAGTIPEGVQVWVRGSAYGDHTMVTVADGTVNRGRIRMESADGGYSSNLSLAGVLTNGPTGLIDSQVGSFGDRVISGTLVNQGLVDATAYYITYYGTYEVAGGRVLGAVNFGGITLRQTASPGELNVLRLMGTTTLASDNLPNVELWINGGGWLGDGILTGLGGRENRGIIRMESTDGGYPSVLSSGGTFVNGAAGLLQFNAGSGGPRRMDVSVDNHGTIRTELGQFVDCDGTGRTFRQLGGSSEAVMGWSGGTLEFVDGVIGGFLMARNAAVTVHETADPGSLLIVCGASGQLAGTIPEGVQVWVRGSAYGDHTTVTVADGTVNRGRIRMESADGGYSSNLSLAGVLTNGPTGLIDSQVGSFGDRVISGTLVNQGLVDATAYYITYYGTYEVAGGRVLGAVNFGGITLRQTASPGELNVLRLMGTTTLASDNLPNVELWINGGGWLGDGILTGLGGRENRGIIRMESTDGGYPSVLSSGGTFVNGAAGLLQFNAGSGGPRRMDVSVDNHGTIRTELGQFVDCDGTGRTFRQLGGSSEAVMGWSGGTLEFVDGVIGGFLMARNAAVTVHETADPGSLLIVCGASGQLAGTIPEGVQVWVRGSAYGDHTMVTVADGTVNRGRIRMESADAGYSSNLSLAGVLTNGPTGLIDSQVGSFGDRVISGTLVNQGLLDATAYYISYYGTYEVAGGRVLGAVNFFSVAVRMTASPSELTTLRLVGSSTLLTDNLPNVELWVNGSDMGNTGTLNVNSGLVNRGIIRVASSEQGYVSQIAGTGPLTNGPTGRITFQSGSGGPRNLWVSVVNQGLFQVEGGVGLVGSGADGRTFTQEAGSLEVAGGAWFTWDGGLLRHVGGTTSGEVFVRSGTMEVGSGAGTGWLTAMGSTSLELMESPLVTVQVRGSDFGGHTTMGVRDGLVNRGTIVMQSTEQGYASSIQGVGTLVNAAGALIVANGGSGGPRRLDVSVDNRGTIRTEAGVFLESDGTGRVFRQLGGSMEAAMGWSGGTFEFVDGLIGGFLMVRDGAVAVEGTADPGSVLILTGGGASLSGHVPEGVEIWVRGSHYGGHTSVTVQDGTLNDGRIRMESADAGYSSNLSLAGVLTNGPTGLIDSQAGSGGDRVISGTLVNQGLLDATAYYISYYGTYEVAGGRVLGAVNFFSVAVRMTASPSELTTLRLVGSSTLLTDNLPNVELWVNGSDMGNTGTLNVNSGLVNRGIIRVASSEQGYVSQIAGTGPLTNGPTGRITFQSGSGGPRNLWVSVVNQGLFQVEGGVGLVGSGADGRTFTQEAGSLEVAGGAWFTWDGGLLRHVGGTTSGEVFVRSGTMEVGSGAGTGWLTAMGSTSLELMESPLVTVQVRGSDFGGHTTMGVRDGLVNRGTIVMQSTEQGYASSIQGVGTLVNAAGALIVANGGSGGPRRLDVSVDNRGTIRTEAGVFLESDGTGRLFRQLGGSMEAAMGWSGGTFEFVDGLIGGFLMVRSGAVAVEVTADPGSVLILTGGGASLSGHVPEGVEIWVRGSNYGGHTSVAVQDGTLNDGRIRMEAADAGYSSNLSLAGVLTNGPTGVIDSQVGSGGDRVISGTLVNQGLLDATPFFITYYGTYEVAGGRAVGVVNFFHVTLRQTASPALPNTLRLMGDSTLLTDNLANVELWVNGSSPGGTATLSVVDGVVNRGMLRTESTDGGYVSQIISAGTLRNAPAGQMRFAAGAGGPRSFTGQLLNAGMVTVDPGMLLTVVGPTFDNLETGLVTGQGSYDVTFTLFRNAGVISPAGGSLTFTGNVQMETGGVVELAIAGPQAYFEHEQVFVNGLANLRGSLRVVLAPEYHPAAGTELLLISATVRFGIFQTLQHPGTTTVMSAVYDSTSVRLLVDNGAPIAVEDTIERKRGAGIKIRPARLLLNDQDPEGQALTVVSVGASSASGGSVVMEEGWIIYSPQPGAPLFDSFTYVVRDSAGAETQGQVTIVEAGMDGQPSRNISGISVPEGGPAMVRGHGIPGRTYRIDVKSQLSDPDWQPLGSIQVGPDGTWNLPDEAASAHETRFYRTVEL